MKQNSKSSAWKRSEVRVCEELGCDRIGITGKATTDGVNSKLSIETKRSKSFPKYLTDAVAQSARNATDNRVPAVVLHYHNIQHENDLIFFRVKDFKRLIEEITGESTFAKDEI